MKSLVCFIFFTFCKFSISIATYKKKYNDEIQLPYKIPSKYNFFNDFSFCNYLPDNKDSCLGDYAQGVFLSISHRICKDDHKPFKLSYQYLSACDSLNLGCEKGNSQSLIYFLEQNGAPSEADSPWESIVNYNESYCLKFDKIKVKFYKIVHGSNKILNDADQIQKEIFLFGPVSTFVSDLSISEDNDSINNNESIMSTQTIEIVGWEENEGELFWITFNEKWGQRYIRARSNDGLPEISIYSYEIYSTID